MLPRVLSIFLFAAALFIATPPPASAADKFTPAQKTKIEELIRSYLLEHPELLLEVMERLEEKQKTAARDGAREMIQRHQAELFQSTNDFVINPEGTIPMVEFFDYQCGYCKRILDDVMKLAAANPDVRVILKEFPILGEGSVMAARATLAAQKQGKYLEMHNALMSMRRQIDDAAVMAVAADLGLDATQMREDMASSEVQSIIDENLALARRMNIRGTPTLIIGDNLVPGAISFEQMLALVDEAATNCRVC